MTNELSQNKINRIKIIVDKIKKITEKQGKYCYYIINNDNINVKLISKSNKKKEAKQIFLQKIGTNKKYIDYYVYQVKITVDEKYILNNNNFIIGPVFLNIKEYTINNKFKLHYEPSYKYGTVWYLNKDLLKNAFHFSDIRDIIKIIYDNNLNIMAIAKIRAIKLLSK